MRRDRFLKNSLIMIFSNSITGVFGFTFSIILSKHLGSEGMGLYGLVMPIYDLFICLICGGMITAISKVSAVYYSKNDFKNLNRTIDSSLLFDSIWAVIIACSVFLFSFDISNFVIKDDRTLQAVRVMCPAMFFIALSSIFKGYFYGVSDIKTPAFIDICEKFFRIVIFLSIVNVFLLKDVKNTVTAAYITLTIGEALSFILLYIFYIRKKDKLGTTFSVSEDKLQLLFNVLIISFPLCINGFFSTSLGAISALIVPRRLISAGIEYSAALSMIGKFTGMSLNIIFFPIIIVNSICTVLIPDISEMISKKKYWLVENRIHQVLKISFLLGATTTIICVCIPHYLGLLFYEREDLGSYIRFASLCAPFYFSGITTLGILNGLGKQNIVLKNSLIVSFLQLILLYILTSIPCINIYGYGITLIITGITMVSLNIYEIKKRFCIEISLYDLSIFIIMCLFLYLSVSIINNIFYSYGLFLKTIFIIIFSFTICFTFIFIERKLNI